MTDPRNDAYLADLVTQVADQLARYSYRPGWVFSVRIAEDKFLAALEFQIKTPEEETVSFLLHAFEAAQIPHDPRQLTNRLTYVLERVELSRARRALLFDGQPALPT